MAGSDATRLAELAGAPPRLASAADLQAAGPKTGYTHPRQASSSTKGSHKLNLKYVVEACVDEGLDPATEIARVLKGRQVLDDDGEPILDPRTGKPALEYDVDPEVRLRTLSSLLDYTQPKLKAVEVKMSGSLELTNEQLDQRLAALLARTQA